MTTRQASWKEGLTPLPEASFLHHMFTYEPDTGRLIWNKNLKEAGCRQKRRNGEPNAVRVGIQFGEKLVQFVAHRIIWAMMNTEPVPHGMVIDHRDGNPFNNKWGNLRLATHGKNLCNQKRVSKRKHDLPANVYPNGRGFFAMVKVDGVVRRSPTVHTLSEAINSRDSLLKEHGEFAKNVEVAA